MFDCVEVPVLDEVEESLQNQKHSVVKETICIRLAGTEKYIPCQGGPPKKLLLASFEYRGSFQGRRSLGTAPQQPSS
jgi:hypothetical protein